MFDRNGPASLMLGHLLQMRIGELNIISHSKQAMCELAEVYMDLPVDLFCDQSRTAHDKGINSC